MAQVQPTAPQRVRIRTYYIIACIATVFSFYDLYVEVHDPYPRIEAEKLATFLFWLSMVPLEKRSLVRESTRVSWWIVIQTDFLLIGMALFSYSIQYHLMRQLFNPIT